MSEQKLPAGFTPIDEQSNVPQLPSGFEPVKEDLPVISEPEKKKGVLEQFFAPVQNLMQSAPPSTDLQKPTSINDLSTDAVAKSQALSNNLGQKTGDSQAIVTANNVANKTQDKTTTNDQQMLDNAKTKSWREQISVYQQYLKNQEATNYDKLKSKPYIGKQGEPVNYEMLTESVQNAPTEYDEQAGRGLMQTEKQKEQPILKHYSYIHEKDLSNQMKYEAKVNAVNTLKNMADNQTNLSDANPDDLFEQHLKDISPNTHKYEMEKANAMNENKFGFHNNAFEYKQHLLDTKLGAMETILGSESIKSFMSLANKVMQARDAKLDNPDTQKDEKALEEMMQNPAYVEYISTMQASDENKKQWVGLIDKPEFADIKEKATNNKEWQAIIDKGAKSTILAPIGMPNLSLPLGTVAHGLNALANMSSGLIGLARDATQFTKTEGHYGFMDKVADWALANTDQIPTPSKDKTALFDKQAEYRGYVLHFDDNGNIRVSDKDGFDVSAQEADKITSQYNTDANKPKPKDKTNLSVAPQKLVNMLVDLGLLVEGGKGVGSFAKLGRMGETGAAITGNMVSTVVNMHDAVYKTAYEKLKDQPDREKKAALYTNIINGGVGLVGVFNPVKMGLMGKAMQEAEPTLTKAFFQNLTREADVNMIANISQKDVAKMFAAYVETGVKNGALSGLDMGIGMKLPQVAVDHYMQSKYGDNFQNDFDLQSNATKEEFLLGFAVGALGLHETVKPDYQLEALQSAVKSPEKYSALIDKMVVSKSLTDEQGVFQKARILGIANSLKGIDTEGMTDAQKNKILGLVDASVQMKLRSDEAMEPAMKNIYKEKAKEAENELRKELGFEVQGKENARPIRPSQRTEPKPEPITEKITPNDSQNNKGLPSNERSGETPIQAESDKGTSTETPRPSRVLQAQEKVVSNETKVVQNERDASGSIIEPKGNGREERVDTRTKEEIAAAEAEFKGTVDKVAEIAPDLTEEQHDEAASIHIASQESDNPLTIEQAVEEVKNDSPQKRIEVLQNYLDNGWYQSESEKAQVEEEIKNLQSSLENKPSGTKVVGSGVGGDVVSFVNNFEIKGNREYPTLDKAKNLVTKLNTAKERLKGLNENPEETLGLSKSQSNFNYALKKTKEATETEIKETEYKIDKFKREITKEAELQGLSKEEVLKAVEQSLPTQETPTIETQPVNEHIAAFDAIEQADKSKKSVKEKLKAAKEAVKSMGEIGEKAIFIHENFPEIVEKLKAEEHEGQPLLKVKC